MARDAGKPFLAESNIKKRNLAQSKVPPVRFGCVAGLLDMPMISTPVFIVFFGKLWENCTMDRIN